MRSNFITTALTLLLIMATAGCVRDRASENPPVHINPNMDNQPKYRPQSESKFFADGSAMRVPVPGTVARGELRDSIEYYTGRTGDGEFIKTMPAHVPMTMALLRRGQERYNIFCSPCHGRVGDGKGIMVSRGYVPPPSFHTDRIRELPDGHIFDVITDGVGNMPAYRYQVPVDDRWAIVAYMRALQRSQNATLDDVPQPKRQDLR